MVTRQVDWLTWAGIYPARFGDVGDFRPAYGYYVLVTSPLLLALLLGLRHATDPDHLTAVSTLLLNQEDNGPRRAALLGWAWGLGHATTLGALGLPFIMFDLQLTQEIQRAAEMLIGLLIAILAGRLLLRWRRGYFHMHPHLHGSVAHVHPHAHEHSGGAGAHPTVHRHSHAENLGRSPLTSFGLGLVHGVGGSAGVGVLLLASTSTPMEGAAAMLVFATGSASSMVIISLAFAHTLGKQGIQRRLADLVPILATASLIFGVWYSVGAAGLMP
jgi:cytochrome c biogenesis protein CcdA